MHGAAGRASTGRAHGQICSGAAGNETIRCGGIGGRRFADCPHRNTTCRLAGWGIGERHACAGRTGRTSRRGCKRRRGGAGARCTRWRNPVSASRARRVDSLAVAALHIQRTGVVRSDARNVAGMRQIARAPIRARNLNGPFDNLNRCAGIINRDAKGRALYDGGQIRRLHGKMRLAAFAYAIDGVAEAFKQLG